MANNKKQLEDTEELRRVISELQAKVDALQNEDAIENSEAGILASGEYVEESYVAYNPEENQVNDQVDTTEEDQDINQPENQEYNQKNNEPEEEYVSDEVPEELYEEAPLDEEIEIVEEPVKKKKKKKKKSSSSEDIIISMDNVTMSYEKNIPALDNVSLKIKRGEFVFIVGSSGSGKSTLIRLLLREIKPTSGKIMVNGFQVDRIRHYKIPKLRRSMGIVFQNFRLLKDRNVYENVAFAQRIIEAPRREMKKNVTAALKIVGLASKYRSKPSELSGGEQQRVALARALVNRPPILLCDEPTGNLDPKNTIDIMNLLDEINQNGTTVVVVTHNDKIVNDMQKRVITIRNGIVVSDEEKGIYIDED